jgi:hypothetical protein
MCSYNFLQFGSPRSAPTLKPAKDSSATLSSHTSSCPSNTNNSHTSTTTISCTSITSSSCTSTPSSSHTSITSSSYTSTTSSSRTSTTSSSRPYIQQTPPRNISRCGPWSFYGSRNCPENGIAGLLGAISRRLRASAELSRARARFSPRKTQK